MTNDLYFAVEGGSTLELAHKHVRDEQDMMSRNKVLLDELGVERYFPSLDGTVAGVDFGSKPVHPDFRKPDRKGRSWPKKGTEWARRFSEQTGYDRRGFGLAKALGVPTSLYYTYDDGEGMSSIGRGFNPGVGFLYLSEIGPFALYVPNIAAKVADYEARGYTVDDACKNFKPEFDGCRPILKQEWELAVAQHELEEAKREACL